MKSITSYKSYQWGSIFRQIWVSQKQCTITSWH